MNNIQQQVFNYRKQTSKKLFFNRFIEISYYFVWKGYICKYFSNNPCIGAHTVFTKTNFIKPIRLKTTQKIDEIENKLKLENLKQKSRIVFVSQVKKFIHHQKYFFLKRRSAIIAV